VSLPAAPEWVRLLLKLLTAIVVVLGSFSGGEFRGMARGEEAALPAALELARGVVAEKLEDVTFRALDAEAEAASRPPPSVVVHLATVISELEADLSACETRGR
jgi:hypothetical protein